MTRVAHLGRSHGLEGFLGLYVDPDDLVHFQSGAIVEVDGRSFTVRQVRRGPRGHQVAFVEAPDRESAENIRNREVFVSAPRPLGEDEYRPSQLIGLEVRPGGGAVVGVVNAPAQDRLVIDRAGVIFEVPFVEALVPVVDLEGGYLELVEIEGLDQQ
jgi:16S rRNA processing protein RimM